MRACVARGLQESNRSAGLTMALIEKQSAAFAVINDRGAASVGLSALKNERTFDSVGRLTKGVRKFRQLQVQTQATNRHVCSLMNWPTLLLG